MEQPVDLVLLEAKAAKAAAFLRSLAHEHRLLVLCKLMERPHTAGELSQAIGLLPSNLSQHLAKLKAEGLIDYDRSGATLTYRVSADRVRPFMAELYAVFCGDGAGTEAARTTLAADRMPDPGAIDPDPRLAPLTADQTVKPKP